MGYGKEVAGKLKMKVEKDENYLKVKHEVLSILRKKLDEKNYKKTIKVCKKSAGKVTDKWKLGESLKSFKITAKKLKKGAK